MGHQQAGLRHNISFVTLGVEDLKRSRNFYMAMGLEEHSSSNDHVAFFDMGGQLFALFDRDQLAADAGVEWDDGKGMRGRFPRTSRSARTLIGSWDVPQWPAAASSRSHPPHHGVVFVATSQIRTAFSGRSRGIRRRGSMYGRVHLSKQD